MAILKETKIRTSILFTLTLLFFCIGVLPLLISNWKLITLNREVLERSLQENFVTTASTVSSRIGSYMSIARSQIREVAPKAASEIGRADNTPGEADLHALINSNRSLIKILVFNSQGNSMGGVASRDLKDPSIGKYEAMAFQVAEQGKSYMSEPYYDRPDDTLLFFLSEPLRNRNDAVIGALTVILSADPMLEILAEESAGGTKVYVVDSVGNLVLHPKKSEMIGRHNLAESALVKDYMSTHGRVSTVRLFEEKQDGKTTEIIGSYSTIPETGWGVIIQIERSIAFASVNAMIRESAKWGILFAFAATIIGFFLARWITTPIQTLAQHAQSIAQNQNFDKKIQMNAGNEIQQLADTFNYMTDEIKQNILGLQWAARENKELFMSSIRMLAAAIDAKDPYTRGHSERVKDYSLVIGRQIGFNDREMERLEICALLHDVGKIGIDDRILRKPTNLTPEEFEVMKTHPDKGASILSQIAQLADIIPGTRAHHENFDGSGYPQGLKGEAIPLLGRVVTIADTFDAMTTDRPYQKAFTLDFALNRIRTMGGIKYDPKIVEAFSKACESGKVSLAKPSRPRPKQPVA